MADDYYAEWYSAKLWAMLPAIYRTLDSPDNGATPGPLQEFCARLGAQAALLRRSIDRLWANQSIETCDDWAIPYIGQLLGARIVPCLPARAQRVDVAKTIHYRRRAGTLGLIEELASDISRHDARAVEFFRRLGRTRHNFDPPVGLAPNLSIHPSPEAMLAATPPRSVIEGLRGPWSRTPAGGFADLRNACAAAHTGTAFDEFCYTADFRRGRQSLGWHGVSRLGVFVWRLYAFAAANGAPVKHATIPDCYTFDPIGRTLPLFSPSQRVKEDFADNWVAPNPWELAAPVRQPLWKMLPPAFYPESFAIAVGEGEEPPVLDASEFEIWPETGCFRFRNGPPAATVSVAYHFGFSAAIGAGAAEPSALPTPAAAVELRFDPDVPSQLDTALKGMSGDTTLRFLDSRTYRGPASDPGANAHPPLNLALVAQPGKRPVLRLQPQAAWTLTGGNGDLVLQGLWLQGADLILAGDWNKVTLQGCTLDPGSTEPLPPYAPLQGIDGLTLAPTRLYIEGKITELIVDRCVTGPILARNAGDFAMLTVTDSIVQAVPEQSAIACDVGRARLSRVTVLGKTSLDALSASECIFDDVVRVRNAQAGCVRYCTLASGHNLHAPFRCATVWERSDMFESRAFGHPRYARVSAGADQFVALDPTLQPPPSVLTGASAGGQPGAFCAEQDALLARGLAAKIEEYAPAGLVPVWVDC